jgi:hypothetical protein
LIAGAVGALAGIVLYIGYYYCGLVYHLGPQVIARPDVLPYYIRARMASDVIRDANTDRDDEAPRKSKGDSWFNWLTFGMELTFTVGITAGLGVMRARKPYCNVCQKWMVREVTQFEPNQATSILDALRTGSARSLAALCARPVFATIPNVSLAIEICPTIREGTSRDCPIYTSLKLIPAAAQSATRDPFDGPNGKLLLRSLRLNTDEIAALGSRFKIFESIAGRAAVAAYKPDEPAETSANVPSGPVAEINAVEPDYAGKVLTKRNVAIGTASAFAGLLILFAGLGLAAWGGMMAFPDKNSLQDVPPAKKTLGIAILSLGGLLFAGSAIFFLVNPTYFRERFLLRKAREEFSRRPKCLVDPNDPDALFIEIVPKLNWGRAMLETASDVGFLKVNPSRKELLFEGDKQRFRIPVEAITACGVETFVEGKGTHAARTIYYVVLRANRPGEFWEAPIRERTSSGMFKSGRRRKSAERLFQSINDLLVSSRTASVK